MSFDTHVHRPNGMGARDQNGRMVCGTCGRPYDDRREVAR